MNSEEKAVKVTHKIAVPSKKELPAKLKTTGIILLAAGLLLIIAAYLTDRTRASFNLVILFMFLASIGVGSLFLVALEYAAGAVWSTPIRRIPEFLSATLLVLPVIAAVLLFNLHDLFHWTHAEAVEHDAVLKSKAPYLNTTFFIIRTAVFLGMWLFFYLWITRNSKKQDSTGDQKLTRLNIKLSAIFIPLFAISITFLAVDWVMSLEPHWLSTIFGVYYFAGTFVAALAATTIAVVLLREKGYFPILLLKDHLYSLGALMFAIINFWAYIAFSQYLLIWYANIPEETSWMFLRWFGSWKYVSIGLIVGHFLIPYFALLSQPAKMNPKRLLIMSVWILVAHWYDVYWLVMPTYSKSGAVLGWMEFAFPVFAAGLLIMIFVIKAKNNNMLPAGDPKLERGINFRL